jgi:hypothetical protein
MASTAQAAIVNWSATLAPENEVPPVMNSSGSGSASGTVDTNSGLLTWDISWADLTGPAVGAHFHAQATKAQNAPVVVTVGAISGLSSPTIGDTVITAPQVAFLLAGLWYINVHTATNPDGEIRGQVAAVPVPATLPLLLGAGLAIGWLARRRT